MLGFDGDDDGADPDLDVDSSVAGLGGLFFRVKTAFAQLVGKPDVQTVSRVREVNSGLRFGMGRALHRIGVRDDVVFDNVKSFSKYLPYLPYLPPAIAETALGKRWHF